MGRDERESREGVRRRGSQKKKEQREGRWVYVGKRGWIVAEKRAPIHHTPEHLMADRWGTLAVHLSLPGLIIKAAPFFVTHIPAGLRGGFPAKSFTLVDKPALPLKADGPLWGETQSPVLPSSRVRVQPHLCPS